MQSQGRNTGFRNKCNNSHETAGVHDAVPRLAEAVQQTHHDNDDGDDDDDDGNGGDDTDGDDNDDDNDEAVVMKEPKGKNIWFCFLLLFLLLQMSLLSLEVFLSLCVFVVLETLRQLFVFLQSAIAKFRDREFWLQTLIKQIIN